MVSAVASILARHWPAAALLASAAMLAVAHAFETFGGLEPCHLCLQQRTAYWIAGGVAFAGLAVRADPPTPAMGREGARGHLPGRRGDRRAPGWRGVVLVAGAAVLFRNQDGYLGRPAARPEWRGHARPALRRRGLAAGGSVHGGLERPGLGGAGRDERVGGEGAAQLAPP